MARGWNREPTYVTSGSDRTEVSAALWTNSDPESIQKVAADPNPAQHVVCIEQSRVRASFVLDGRQRLDRWIEPGEITLIPAGACAEGVRRGRWGMLHLYVPDALLRRLVDAEQLSTRPDAVELVASRSAPDPIISHIGREMLAEMRQGQPLSRLRVDALGQDLAIRLLRAHSNLGGLRDVQVAVRGGLATWQIKRACDAMDAQLDGGIGLDTLANLAGVSPTHFSRAFKRSTGVPPFAWLLQRRIERAKDLLADPKMPLAEVALAVGFAAQPQFTTAFRRVTGMTPGAWRRERLR